jgi:hypothetical protein
MLLIFVVYYLYKFILKGLGIWRQYLTKITAVDLSIEVSFSIDSNI